MLAHKIVSRDDWLMARKVHLQREKELTRMRDRLSAERRELPWVKVEEEYVFDGPKGREDARRALRRTQPAHHLSLHVRPGLGGGLSRLLVPLAITSTEPTCTLSITTCRSSQFRARRYREIEAFKKRMGWRFKWVSSYGSDFNHDFHVSSTEEEVAKGNIDYNFARRIRKDEMPGISVFFKDDDGNIFHTYSPTRAEATS